MNYINILILVLLLLLIPTAHAGLSEDGEGIIAGGMEQFLVNLGDSCFEMSMQLHGNKSVVDGNVSAAVFDMATLSINPFQFPPVLAVQVTCALIYLIIGIILILIYGIQAIIAHYRPQAMQSLNYITGQSNSTPLPELVSKIGSVYLVLLFTDFAILLILGVNFVLCSMIMIDVIDHITVVPDNPLFYLCFGVIYLIMNLFYVYRSMVICICAAFGLLIGALYIIEATKGIANLIISYFIVMTFMQFIIAAICAVIIPIIEGGFALIGDVPGGIILQAGPGGFFYIVSYFILLAILFAVGVVCVFSPLIMILVALLFRKMMFKIV